ncbi:hypothetical protein BJ165DRAFT_1144046 [Panaeolus papilionaceus]|nr:hypothetical protein BJ165DRAFT_1144046 [Panaeolus papilionaceus]
MSSIPTVSELEQTLGVILIGYVVAMVVFGITVFQTYVYYSKYGLDSIWTKTVVGSLCFLDVVMTILVSHAIYHYMILQYPFTTGLINATPTYSAQLGLSVVALFIVQLFYAFHTWRASKNIVVSMFITSTSLAAFVLGLVVAANLVRDSAFSSLTEGSSKVIMITSKSLVCLSSFFTAGVLSYYLYPSTNPSVSVINDFNDGQVHLLLNRYGCHSSFLQARYIRTAC